MQGASTTEPRVDDAGPHSDCDIILTTVLPQQTTLGWTRSAAGRAAHAGPPPLGHARMQPGQANAAMRRCRRCIMLARGWTSGFGSARRHRHLPCHQVWDCYCCCCCRCCAEVCMQAGQTHRGDRCDAGQCTIITDHDCLECHLVGEGATLCAFALQRVVVLLGSQSVTISNNQ